MKEDKQSYRRYKDRKKISRKREKTVAEIKALQIYAANQHV